MKRRDFLKKSTLLAAASQCPWLIPQGSATFAPKRILVLGGTSFLGPAVVNVLLVSGHSVTLFNRGITNPDLFPHVEKLRGFRSSNANDQNFSSISNRRFDVIIDVWPNEPNLVALAANALKNQDAHYLFVSSVGAYDHREFAKAGVTEDAPMEPFNSSWRAYNRNKAESERRLRGIIGERLTIVRPGPIAGHRDGGGDLIVWLLRAQDGSPHIAPGDGTDPVQFVDVKDVAAFLGMAVTRQIYGAFNLTGSSMTFREFLDNCSNTTGSNAKFTWIPQKFLQNQGLESNDTLHTFVGNFPWWLPNHDYQGLYRINSDKAIRAGWALRPFSETAFDCLNDYYSGNLEEAMSPLSSQREREVLNAWLQRKP